MKGTITNVENALAMETLKKYKGKKMTQGQARMIQQIESTGYEKFTGNSFNEAYTYIKTYKEKVRAKGSSNSIMI